MERNDQCFCGSGKKYKKCHYRINGESKLAKIYKAQSEYDSYCQANGLCNNCIAGCSKCCHDFFFVTEMEFLTVLEYLDYNKYDISDYVTRAKKVLADIKLKYPLIIDKLDEYMPTTQTSRRPETTFFDDSFNSKDLPICIFVNEENKCSIYDVRPYVCRGYGTSETCVFINNNKIDFQEKVNLILEGDMLSSSVSEKTIIKRPYPLFYWFAYFLDEKYYDIVITKMRKFRDLKNDQYYDFNCKLI